MARTYVASNKADYMRLFQIDESNAYNYQKVLVNLFQDNISTLQQYLNLKHANTLDNANAVWPMERQEFITDYLTDVFNVFTRYDYTLSIGDELIDDKTKFRYQIVSVSNGDTDDRDWTPDDVGTTDFASEFESVMGIPPTGIPNKIQWTLYTNTKSNLSTIASMQKAKGSVLAILIWAPEYSNWVFKVSDDSANNMCHSFKEYLVNRKD